MPNMTKKYELNSMLKPSLLAKYIFSTGWQPKIKIVFVREVS